MTYTETLTSIHDAGLSDNNRAFMGVSAVGSVMPCLIDWIETTGYGEANVRDRKALALCVATIDAFHTEMRLWGCQPEPNPTLDRARELSKGYEPTNYPFDFKR